MRDLLKYALLAGAGWFAWRNWFAAPDVTAPGSSGSTSPAPTSTPASGTTQGNSSGTSNPPAPPASTPPPPSQPVPIQTLVSNAAARAGYPAGSLLSFDEWNYFYQQVRGAYGPAWEDANPTKPREYKMSLAEWWAMVSPLGVS